MLASGFPRSLPLRLVGDDVVWASFGDDNSGTGKILRVPQTGGEVEVLADELGIPWDIAVAEPWIYWADTMAGVVAKIGVDGGESVVVAPFPDVLRLALDTTHIYAVSAGDSGVLARVPVEGGELEELLTGLDNASSLLVHDSALFWIESGATLEVRTMPKAGGEVASLSMVVGPSRGLAVNNTHLYWLSAGPGGGVLRAPSEGGPAEVLVSPEIPAVLGLALNSEYIFWTNAEEHALSYAGLRGLNPTVLVENIERPEEIVLSPTHAFFTDFYEGRVLRVGLP